MNIDKTLRDIVFKASGGISDMASEEIAAIHKAYKDAGYVQKEWRSTGTINGQQFEHKEVMTGQEFLYRFTKEWEHYGKPMEIDVWRAAKRAAGLDETE